MNEYTVVGAYEDGSFFVNHTMAASAQEVRVRTEHAALIFPGHLFSIEPDTPEPTNASYRAAFYEAGRKEFEG